jgi:hypothetical protein
MVVYVSSCPFLRPLLPARFSPKHVVLQSNLVFQSKHRGVERTEVEGRRVVDFADENKGRDCFDPVSIEQSGGERREGSQSRD